MTLHVDLAILQPSRKYYLDIISDAQQFGRLCIGEVSDYEAQELTGTSTWRGEHRFSTVSN